MLHRSRLAADNEHGLTLLELLMVLAIVSILFNYALPSLSKIIARSTNLTLSYQLINLVQYARTAAITKHQTVTLCGSSDGVICDGSWSNKILVFLDIESNGQIDKNDLVLQVATTAPQNGSLLWRSFRNKSYLQLLPTGTTYFQNGNFLYCPQNQDPHNAFTLILNTSGRLRQGLDHNHNGIPEGSDGKDITCPN